MLLIFMIAWGLVVILVLLLAFIIVRMIFGKDPYLFELIQMRPGVNSHIRVYSKTLEFKHKNGDLELEIDTDRIYRVKPSFAERIKFRIQGVSNKFTVIYREKKKAPVSFETSEVSSRVLKIIEESRALEKAMRDEFSIPWDLKKIVLIFGFLLVVAIVYLVATGQVVV